MGSVTYLEHGFTKFNSIRADLGMSLDSKSADQVTTNQIGYFEAWNISFFGLFKENMTTSGS